uniref:G-protein coupled receptors family 1 profile domain-containing protein n=1 Tax=Anopheles maculatus TaxID=74869 RepID=A0A182STX0_9DIPT
MGSTFSVECNPHSGAIYILSLALADLLLIVTTVPFTSIIYTVDSWPWGSLICTSSEFIKDVSIGVSVFTLVALSGDRFFAIVDPLRKFHAHGKIRFQRSDLASVSHAMIRRFMFVLVKFSVYPSKSV